MIIVDSSVWIDYLGNKPSPQSQWLDHALGRRRFGLTDQILCEVLQGARNEHDANRIDRVLRNFRLFTPGTRELAIASARNYRTLRAQGITVRKTIDCFIATFCLENGHSLLHRDRDFDSFEQHFGLSVVDTTR